MKNGPLSTADISTASLSKLVNGWLDIIGANDRCWVRVWDDAAATQSPYYNTVTPSGGSSSGSDTAVFPVATGKHNYSVRIESDRSTVAVDVVFGTITAQFVPYNGVGTKAPSKAAASAASQPIP